MSEPLTKLGITKPRIALLNELGINDVDSLLTYYPYRYDFLVYHQPEFDDFSITADGVITASAKIAYRRGYQSKMVFTVMIENQEYQVSIFNRHFLASKLKLGQTVTIIGKCNGPTTIVASDVKLAALSDLPAITPVYSVKDGITSKSVHGYVVKALNYAEDKTEDFIPLDFQTKYRLVNRYQALKMIHCPKEKSDIKHALRHLKYEEFLKFQLMMNYMHTQKSEAIGLQKVFSQEAVQYFIKHLPFALTQDQQTTCDEILADLQGDKLMNRLVQGDVGSGKTVVGVIAMYANYLAGYQSALMAPTEILAKQHYQNLIRYFEAYDIKLGLLIGSMTNKEKEQMYEALESGEIDMVIGTHALIQSKVAFHRLGLVIADEQHRFGVKQRQNLKTKGQRVDMLLMSATPIPRTLAISLFGDMEVSTIKTMPSGRKPVKTKYYQGKSMKPILPFLKEYLASGQQCYVVCPLVDESDGLAARDAQSIYEAMKKYFQGHYAVGLLHGRMNDEDKEQIMNAFRDNKIQILVSTTVIEVGVDVGNANMMVIYNADRFGLSTLHQLRGRVGRKDRQGYCFLLSDSQNEASIERVRFLENSNDGFEISEFDLKLRGPGEVLGEKQSGVPTFTIANLFEDYQILETARQDAQKILENLKSYPHIARFLLKALQEKMV